MLLCAGLCGLIWVEVLLPLPRVEKPLRAWFLQESQALPKERPDYSTGWYGLTLRLAERGGGGTSPARKQLAGTAPKEEVLEVT